MLQDAISSVDYEFEIESVIAKQVGAVTLPFPGMDKNKAPVCEFFLEGSCNKGANCPYRHFRGDRVIVCKHWLRQLCNKGDDCEFLHEYDMGRMPVCYFYQKFGECSNKDCQFMHVDADTLKIKDCPWYDRGFCKHGPNCRNRHTRRVICQKYLFGFCPDGNKCRFQHPRYELPGTRTLPAYSAAIFGNPTVLTTATPNSNDGTLVTPSSSQTPAAQPTINSVTVGGVASTSLTPGDTTSVTSIVGNVPTSIAAGNIVPNTAAATGGGNTVGGPAAKIHRRPLHEVTCFKCGEKGHYANTCPKSYRAQQLGLVGTPNVGVK